MFTNYLKIAFRNLIKRKGYSLLNILGLTIGMTCCLLIFQYVSYERSYDDFHANANDIVRIRLDSYQKGQLAWKSATSYPAIAPTLKKDYPEVEDFCRLIDAELLISNDEMNVKFNETKGYFADPSVLEMFRVKIVIGNPDNALDGPDKILISETMARKYFGNAEALGKKLTVRDPDFLQTYEVTGVFKDYPTNSHLTINHLISYATLGKILRLSGDTSNSSETAWGWYDFYTYLKLKPGTDLQKFETKLPAFCDQYINSREWNKTNNNKTELHLVRLSDIHLYSNYNQEAEVNGNGQAVSFLFLVAILIIAIAWINYINLATARSIERAREVGVRKVMGALRTDLIRQFLMESFLLNFLSLILSVSLFLLLIPVFDRFSGREVVTGLSLTPQYWKFFLSIFMGGTLLSGLYPAFILSSFQPVAVLKGIFRNSGRGLILRKGLIIAQFITSVVLIAGTIIVYQQVNYMRKQQLGVNIDQTVVLNGVVSVVDSIYGNVFQPFRTELLRLPGVKNVSASSGVMGNEIYWTNGIRRLGVESKTAVTLYHLGIDYDFVPSFDLKLTAGRNFSREFGTDEKAVLLNEHAATLLGFASPAAAINGKLRRNSDTLTVVGIVANFHHMGLQRQIDPMILLLRPNSRSHYSLKIETTNIKQTIASVEKIWGRYFPSDPFGYTFLNETFEQQYKADLLFGKVFAVFAFLAILIACFGLLGLSAYNVLMRTKEIGIRKVLGASGQNILLLLSKDFLRLILIALVMAVPIGWYLMHNWLQDFAYRIDVSAWVFVLAGILALLIALVTIGLHAIKAVATNPVNSLRTE